ncbi:hypothetical protein [Nonomuraea sp. JJY05]|uniref:hypothetical protein n=1 Tax=Nonomuraea sp. JJY05 TaxID=3350255 RepID=UPI00373DF42C
MRTELGRKKVRVAAVEPGMADTELPDHVTDADASRLKADRVKETDVLQSDDIAETVAFIAAVPKHVTSPRSPSRRPDRSPECGCCAAPAEDTFGRHSTVGYRGAM